MTTFGHNYYRRCLFSEILVLKGGESKMTVYELIKEVEELTPHSISEVKSKVMMPTYRFVTSANFALGLIVVAMLLNNNIPV